MKHFDVGAYWQIKFPAELNVTKDTIVRMEVGGSHCVVRAVGKVATSYDGEGAWWTVEALFGKLPNMAFESQIEDVIHPEKEEDDQ